MHRRTSVPVNGVAAAGRTVGLPASDLAVVSCCRRGCWPAARRLAEMTKRDVAAQLGGDA